MTDEYIDQYRNTGGFDIIGSGRTKLETPEQFAVAAEVCKKHGITAIVIIGGDDSNKMCIRDRLQRGRNQNLPKSQILYFRFV